MLRTISDNKGLLLLLIPLALGAGLIWVWLYSASTELKPIDSPVSESSIQTSSVRDDASTPVIESVSPASGDLNSAVVPVLSMHTSAQNAIAGLSSDADQDSDELLREIQTMNQELETLLSADDPETSLQAKNAQAIEAEALALIQQVDAELGVDSLQIADDLFEQTSRNISDPALQKVIADGNEIEEEIATIAQALQ